MSSVDTLSADLRKRLRTTSYRVLSAEVGVSVTALQKVLRGVPPGPKVAAALGWRICYANGRGHAVEAAVVRDKLKALWLQAGSMAALGAQLGVGASQVYRSMRVLEPAVLRAMGYSVTYRKNA